MNRKFVKFNVDYETWIIATVVVFTYTMSECHHKHTCTHTTLYTHDVVQPSAAKDTAAYLDTYRDEWREVFVISAELYAFGAVTYLLLGTGKKQYWADGCPPKITKKSVESTTVVKRSVQVETPPPEKAKLIRSHGLDYGSM